MILGSLHVGIYTLDMEASIRFYCDGLGFALRWKGIVPHETGQLPVATVVLGNCVIELVHPADKSRVHRQEGPIQHIALKVDNLDKTIKELVGKRIPLDEGVSEIQYEGGVRHCFIRGPSNERIELGEPL